ncbi:MAG TPA: glycoside hydrolase 100 family protein [Thermomicrobiales bacterium]|nr:glycoside hydrolase 100 family protein [Thermomicrobiales bacterium]
MSDPFPSDRRDDLAARAATVLRRNDLGGWTKAAPTLYPHQWSWDSAFVAIGWAHLDVARAARELRSLFRAQWATGMVPHIVFDPRATGYFPDAARWDASRSPHAPAGVATSGICQPPVHAIAAYRIWETAYRQGEDAVATADAFLRDLYPRLFAWHRYLATARDPEGAGLVTIYHPWESGADNSPRWDGALAAVRVGDLPPYTRSDLQHVADAAQRPTAAEYDRYLWLVEVLKAARYDDDAVRRRAPFLVKDVLFSAILVAANEALLEIAMLLDAPDVERATITGWLDRGRRGLAGRWHADPGLCLDYDLRAGDAIRARTIAGFAPLVAGRLPADRRAALLATLDSPAFLGNAGLRWPLPPSTSPDDPAFRPRSYWRGPVWPVLNWLYWWALGREGEDDRAARLKAAALAQLAGGEFAEYYEPCTGEPLGSPAQSWTAAAVLDWLAAEGEWGT